MIVAPSWHVVKEGRVVPFVKSFRMVADIGQMFTTILVETFVVDRHGVPESSVTSETEYWVKDIGIKDGNPYVEVSDIPQNYGELVP